MTYAVNIADMTYQKLSMFVPLLIQPIAPGKNIIIAGPNVDDMALILECEDDRAAAVVDITKRMAYECSLNVRCYKKEADKWVELPRATEGIMGVKIEEKPKIEAEAPKLSVADRMAKARAARKNKEPKEPVVSEPVKVSMAERMAKLRELKKAKQEGK